MLLEALVKTSDAVASTAARSRKTALISELLGRLEPDEVALGVSYLSGELPQGRLGVGYATVHETTAEPAPSASLSLGDIDQRLGELSRCKGSGSAARRTELLGSLLAASTADEQRFLKRLLVGELRQGALEGVLLEAIAKAANLPADRIRRGRDSRRAPDGVQACPPGT